MFAHPNSDFHLMISAPSPALLHAPLKLICTHLGYLYIHAEPTSVVVRLALVAKSTESSVGVKSPERYLQLPCKLRACLRDGAMSRSPFVEISRLPKLDKNIRSINFRRTTPGSIYPIIHANKPPPPHQALDPTHPALSYLPADYIRAFPWRTCDGFKLRALPHALLQQPSPRHPSPPYQLHTGPTRGERRVNMSLLNIAPRNIGGHVAREQVFRKFKTAISLIATRGAYVEGSGDAAKVVFGDDNDPFDWILTGWVYVIRPEERVYSMPYQHLIPALRDVLRVTAVTGRRLEKEWAKMKESRCAPQSSRTLTLPSSEPPFPSADGKMRATRLLRALREAFADDSATSSTKSREQSTWAEIFSRHSTPASEAPRPGDRDQQRADVKEARSRPRRTAPHGRSREP